jgi:hypothetical protein
MCFGFGICVNMLYVVELIHNIVPMSMYVGWG